MSACLPLTNPVAKSSPQTMPHERLLDRPAVGSPTAHCSEPPVPTHQDHPAHRSSASHFASDERGVIAILFALLLMPLLAVIGLGIDYGRTTRDQNCLQSAADVAVEAGLQQLARESADAEQTAEKQFRANLPKHLLGVPVLISTTDGKRGIKVEAQADIATPIWSIVGRKSVVVAVKAAGRLPEIEDIAARAARKPPAQAAETKRPRRDTGLDLGALPPGVNRADVERAMRELEQIPSFNA